jgi:hypothetical protein
MNYSGPPGWPAGSEEEPETMPSVIPPVVCPIWCTGCEAGEGADGRGFMAHSSVDIRIPHSRGPVDDHSGDMSVYLYGMNGSAPFIGMARDRQWAELTMEEAERLASALASLVSQAQVAESRY